MASASVSARALKRLRKQAGLSVRDMAQVLDFKSASAYQHYEDRYTKPALPIEVVMATARVLIANGLSEQDCQPLLESYPAGMEMEALLEATAKPPAQSTLKVALADDRLEVSASLADGESVDRLIEALKANKELLPGKGGKG
jgi:transcriptional regulator with XRE-family HTH domain|tara:strand:- start:92 stop:520 length:429 start_codon:yes stop_codon:yes gene_type:complete